MPFCTQCGNPVDTTASFCGNCGKAQPRWGGSGSGPIPQGPPPPYIKTKDWLEGISERNASILCYIPVFGVIPSIIFLASQRFRHNQRVRFDGFQSVYLFVAYLITSSGTPFFPHGVHSVFETGLSLCWIFLLFKAAHNEQVHLPIVGDLAARSASEQL